MRVRIFNIIIIHKDDVRFYFILFYFKPKRVINRKHNNQLLIYEKVRSTDLILLSINIFKFDDRLNDYHGQQRRSGKKEILSKSYAIRIKAKKQDYSFLWLGGI